MLGPLDGAGVAELPYKYAAAEQPDMGKFCARTLGPKREVPSCGFDGPLAVLPSKHTPPAMQQLADGCNCRWAPESHPFVDACGATVVRHCPS